MLLTSFCCSVWFVDGSFRFSGAWSIFCGFGEGAGAMCAEGTWALKRRKHPGGFQILVLRIINFSHGDKLFLLEALEQMMGPFTSPMTPQESGCEELAGRWVESEWAHLKGADDLRQRPRS